MRLLLRLTRRDSDLCKKKTFCRKKTDYVASETRAPGARSAAPDTPALRNDVYGSNNEPPIIS